MNEWSRIPKVPPHEVCAALSVVARDLGYNIRDISLVYYDLPDEYLITVSNIEHQTEAVNKVGRN
jgi:hypothetical protein